MKFSFLYTLAALVILISLSACPIGIDYCISDKGKEKIDPKLIGTWALATPDSNAVANKINISKADEYSYKVTIEETGSMFTCDCKEFNVFISTLEGKKYLNMYCDKDNKYYLQAYYINKENKLITADISFLDKGMDGVTSQKNLQAEIISSSKKDGFMQDETQWVKAQ